VCYAPGLKDFGCREKLGQDLGGKMTKISLKKLIRKIEIMGKDEQLRPGLGKRGSVDNEQSMVGECSTYRSNAVTGEGANLGSRRLEGAGRKFQV